MFRPDSNRDRTDYSGILMPPDGYRLDRAVGTTYSLDLEALTAVAICLGLSEETDSKLMQNPIGMLNALQKVSDKIVLFCEAGQIKVPTKPTALSILLEKMVVEVALPKDRQLGRYPAFHPKTWILAYVNAEGDKKYRFVAMSRNLTFDRSWDISFAMDSSKNVRQKKKTQPKRNKGFIAHIDKLRSYLDAPEEIHLGRKPEDLLETLVNMVLGSPAICIYRSNGRSTARATSLAKVFVNNFNLPESTAIIDLAYGRCRDDNSHWQNVLKYCKDGCFQAMIDEYIHMLKETAGFQSDGNQYQIVHDMMMDSLKIHTATYIADTYPDFKKRINGADRKSDGCRIRSSYAVGFTKDAGDNSKVVMRKENIRNAFNSPMRPFVLATTSIGQEGLDFHNYCRVIMHWNLPSNPIDVGRILRTFKIKKNVEVTDNGKIII